MILRGNIVGNPSEVCLACFLSVGFTTIAVINLLDWKLSNRIFVHCCNGSCRSLGAVGPFGNLERIGLCKIIGTVSVYST